MAEKQKNKMGLFCKMVSTLYGTDPGPAAMPSETRYVAENFPDLDTISGYLENDSDNIIALFPIRSVDRDWGIVCRVVHIDKSFVNYRPNTNSSTYAFVLLGEAMERMDLLDQSDGIWELELYTREMMWHSGFNKLGSLEVSRFDSFIERVHQDERFQLIEYVDNARKHGDDDPRLNCELRILLSNDTAS